jgi:hypothetical protein
MSPTKTANDPNANLPWSPDPFSHAKAQSRKENIGNSGLQPKSQKNENPIPHRGIGFSFFCGFVGSERSSFAP